MVRVKPEGPDHFRLEVEDTGMGIRPEDLRRLFVEFQRPDSSAARRDQGSGLGLALTKRLVEAQGGRVGVQSTPDQGSIFHAVLPRAVQAGKLTPAILVVDSDRLERAGIGRILRGAGYAVETAATGAEALARCQARAFAAITLYLFLPDACGWELLHNIGTLSRNCRTPVIVVSMVREKGGAGSFPIHDFLTKPIAPDDLPASLHRAGVRPANVPGPESGRALAAAKTG